MAAHISYNLFSKIFSHTGLFKNCNLFDLNSLKTVLQILARPMNHITPNSMTVQSSRTVYFYATSVQVLCLSDHHLLKDQEE